MRIRNEINLSLGAVVAAQVFTALGAIALLAPLNSAAAWAAVVLGGIGLFIGVLALHNLVRRVEVPLVEIDRALEAARKGEAARRCGLSGGPEELKRISACVDEMINQAQRPSEREAQECAITDRAVLLHLLDARSVPSVILDEDLRVHASNRAALQGLPDAELDALRAALRLGKEAPGWRVEPVGGDRLCERLPGD